MTLGSTFLTRAMAATLVPVLLGAGAPALAQVVTPPPADQSVPDEFKLKTPPPAPPAPPPRPATPPPRNPNRPKPVEIPLPDLSYTSLIAKDAAGNVKVLQEPVDLAALKVNPMITDEERAAMAAYLAERKAAFEKVVIGNLEILDQIENGLLETTDWSSRDSFSPVVQATKPLMPPNTPKPVSVELEQRSMMNIQQKAFNAKIAKEYRDAIAMPRPAAGAPAEEVKEHQRRVIAAAMRDALDESLQTYHALMREAAPRVPQILPTLGLDAAIAADASTRATALLKATEDAAKMQAMRELLRILPAEQRKALFEKSIAMRS